MSPRGRGRERRLAVLEELSAKRAKAEVAVADLLTHFSTAQLRVLLNAARGFHDGTLTGPEADARLAAVPGLPEALADSLAKWPAAHPPGERA